MSRRVETRIITPDNIAYNSNDLKRVDKNTKRVLVNDIDNEKANWKNELLRDKKTLDSLTKK